VPWTVTLDDCFEPEFAAFPNDVQDALLKVAKLLIDYGPRLGRPHADTLNGSKFTNMKELRFEAGDGEWRAAFAFDPARAAIVLVAGDKSGSNQRRFYRHLIAKADRRYSEHLRRLMAVRKGQQNGPWHKPDHRISTVRSAGAH
jgi:hypothetical protein